MENIIQLAKDDDCTGCAACADICPTGSIQLNTNNSLFQKPVINTNTCITCGKCMNVCPALNQTTVQLQKQLYYCTWSLDDNDRLTSTSGGVASAISKYAIEHGYVVYGVAFDDSWRLKTLPAIQKEELVKFKGSKYVQSDMVGVYQSILNNLKDGFPVLFIGTPCQIAGVLRSVPRRYHDKVLTCGIICHGVNSPVVWDDYRNYLERRYGAKLVNYNFRNKSRGWQKKNGTPNLRVSYRFESDKEINEPAWSNQFHYWFGQHLMLRPSCLHCIYRKEERNSDITIGDFWGIHKLKSDVDTRFGVSVLISSTTKGENFIRELKIYKEEFEPSKVIPLLKGYIGTISNNIVKENIKRVREFEALYLKQGFEKMKKKYPHPSIMQLILNSIKFRLGIK